MRTDELRTLPLHRLADMREDMETELFLSDGVLTPEQERRFDALVGTSDEKIERLGLLVCEDVALCAAISVEEDRLAERRRIIENRVTRRKEYVRLQMQRLRKRQVAGALVTVTLQSNSTLSVDASAPGHGPQQDLFARGHPPTSRHRGQHVRIR